MGNNLGQTTNGDATCASPPWSTVALGQIYCLKYVTNGTSNDMRFDYIVPNGVYNVSEGFGEVFYNSAGSESIDIECSLSSVTYSNIDIYAVAGGQNLPINYSCNNITVSNNHLQFAIRFLKGEFTGISELTIAQTSPGSSIPAGVKITGVSVQ